MTDRRKYPGCGRMNIVTMAATSAPRVIPCIVDIGHDATLWKKESSNLILYINLYTLQIKSCNK